MICSKCLGLAHYWWASDDYTEAEVVAFGPYGDCDMRQVFDPRVGCECGCHVVRRGGAP